MVFNVASVGQYGPDPGRIRTRSGRRQLRAVIAAEQRLEPCQVVIEKNIGIMRSIGMYRAAELVWDAKDKLDTALEPYGSLLDVARIAAGDCVGHRDRAEKLVMAQEAHLRAAGPKVMDMARTVVELVRAFNTMQLVWAESVPVFYRKIELAEILNIIKGGKFMRRLHSQYRFTGFSMNQRSPFHTHRLITLVVGQDALHHGPYPVMYTLFESRSGNDIEEIDSPKSVRLVQECEVRVPDGARMNLAEVAVKADFERMTLDDIIALSGKIHLLKRLQPA